MIQFACTHKQCRFTYTISSREAERIVKDKRTAVYHECLRARRELRLMEATR